MSPRARQATQGTMRVLVVDDEETFRFVMENRLRGSGHVVECAPSGEAALERIGERAFDVMLLDLRMPGIGGLEVLRRIKSLMPHCVVVMLTNFRQGPFEEASRAAGADAYFHKASEFERVSEFLLSTISKRRNVPCSSSKS